MVILWVIDRLLELVSHSVWYAAYLCEGFNQDQNVCCVGQGCVGGRWSGEDSECSEGVCLCHHSR